MENKLKERFYSEQVKRLRKYFTKTQVTKMLEAVTNFRNDSSDWVWKNKISEVMNDACNQNQSKKLPSEVESLFRYFNVTSVTRESAVNLLWNLYKGYPSVKEKWYNNN